MEKPEGGAGDDGTPQVQGFTSTIFVTSKIAVPVTPIPRIPQFQSSSFPVGQNNPVTSAPPKFEDEGSEDNPNHDQPTNDSPNSNPSNNNNKNGQNVDNQNGNNQGDDNQDDDNQDDENQNDENQNDDNQNGKNQGGGGVGAIIASIINQSWIPRPAPTPPANNGNPSTPASDSSSGSNDEGDPGPINPAAVISHILKLTMSPAATPLAGQPGQPGQLGQQGQDIPILIGPSDVVIGNQVVPMPSASEQPKVVVVNGQSYTVAATEVVGPYKTVPFPGIGSLIEPSPTPIVVAGVPVIVVGTSQAIISGQTYSIGPSADPTTIVVNGQTISVGSGGVGFASTTLTGSEFTSTAVGGVKVGLGASQAVISGSTYNIGPSATPTTIVVNGQTVSIGPGGVGFASITLQGSSFTSTAVAGVTLGIGASQVVVSGTTYNIGPSATPTTIVVNGQTISIGSGGVGFASVTLQGSSFITTAVAGVTFGVGASQVVLSGTTYNIGPSATPTTIVVNGQTISIGSGGVGFASTTIHGSSLTTTAVGDVTFAIGASQVVISGTTYNIGPSATPTIIVIDGQTISIGPSGLGFASTTISPAGRTTSTSTAQRTSPSSTLPSRTGAEAPTPTPSSAASPSPNTLLNTFTAFFLASAIALIILL
jgi:hypothetical protein